MPLARSFLFVPADRPDRFAKAASAGPHDVILDLEDAVAPDRKQQGREAIASWAGSQGCLVRINPWETDWCRADIDLIREAGISKVMVPKSEPESVDAISRSLGSGVQLIALIETVAGLMQLRAVGSVKGVVRLAFGNLDFGLDSGLAEDALDPVRLQLALESRFANLPPPIDGVSQSLSDAALIETQARRSKSLGFGGKLCIHPAQVAPVNAAFVPTPEEMTWAKRILDAVEAGGTGAIAVDGKMVDRPVAERARAIIGAATR